MNHNLKLTVELYSLRLLRLELPISDGKKISAQIPHPAAKREFAACFAKRWYQFFVWSTRPKKRQSWRNVTQDMQAEATINLPEGLLYPWRRWKSGAYWTTFEFDSRSTDQPAMRRMGGYWGRIASFGIRCAPVREEVQTECGLKWGDHG